MWQHLFPCSVCELQRVCFFHNKIGMSIWEEAEKTSEFMVVNNRYNSGRGNKLTLTIRDHKKTEFIKYHIPSL